MKRTFGQLWSKCRHAWYARKAWKPRFAESGCQLQSELQAEGFYSQCGQDKWLVRELLPNRVRGVFVDIGAHDGQSFSNTLHLERELGWSGLAIEPLPEAYVKLSSLRTCTTVQGCVSAKPGTAAFRAFRGYSEMLSGLAATRDVQHNARVDRELALFGGEVQDIKVQCFTLAELLDQHNIFHVDYMDMDVEGAELSILQTIDFDRFRIEVIAVENNYRDYRIPQLLIRNGFDFHSIVGDEFYVNRRARRLALTPAA